MKILSLLVFLILLSANCANETSSISTSGYSLDATRNYSSSTNPPESTNLTTTTKPTVNVETMELTSGLVPFKACEELLRYFQDEALERVGPYGLEGMGWGPIMPVALGSFAFDNANGNFAESAAVMRTAPGIDFSETVALSELGEETDGIETRVELLRLRLRGRFFLGLGLASSNDSTLLMLSSSLQELRLPTVVCSSSSKPSGA